MGLPMDDIHTPTVPSGPATTHAFRSTDKDGGTSLMDMIAAKTRLEEELKALSSVLDSVCVFPARLDKTLANRFLMRYSMESTCVLA